MSAYVTYWEHISRIYTGECNASRGARIVRAITHGINMTNDFWQNKQSADGCDTRYHLAFPQNIVRTLCVSCESMLVDANVFVPTHIFWEDLPLIASIWANVSLLTHGLMSYCGLMRTRLTLMRNANMVLDLIISWSTIAVKNLGIDPPALRPILDQNVPWLIEHSICKTMGEWQTRTVDDTLVQRAVEWIRKHKKNAHVEALIARIY